MIDIDNVDVTPDTAATAPATLPATEKQIAFATRLGRELAEMVGDDNPYREGTLDSLRSGWKSFTADRRMMSATIDMMLTLTKEWRAADREAVAPAPEGMHRLDGVIYKVQRAVQGSGRPYAKRLTQTACPGHLDTSDPSGFDAPKMPCNDPACTLRKWEFDYAPGVVSRLSDDTRLTLDEAKEWGALYGTCVNCGRTLTDEKSIEAGIGPVCAAKVAAPASTA